MVRKSRTRPVLKGLSRSVACQRVALCARLDGHKGRHRSTLTAVTKSPVKAPRPKVVEPVATEGGVEVLSADRYTVLEEDVVVEPKVIYENEVLGWHIVVFDDGSTTSTKVVPATTRPKVEKARRARRPKVRTLPPVGPSGRDVQTVKGKSSRRRSHYVSGQPSARLA